MADSFLTRAYQKLPFALPSAEADRQIKEREQRIAGRLSHNASDEAEDSIGSRHIVCFQFRSFVKP